MKLDFTRAEQGLIGACYFTRGGQSGSLGVIVKEEPQSDAGADTARERAVESSQSEEKQAVRGRAEVIVLPCTVKAALKWVRETHRHLPRLQGGLFAVACESELEIVGVGIAGNPSRVWQGQRKIVISRVATVGRENACSAVYGALCRASKALGYHEAWTYTLPEEDGTSLRAAGFRDMGMTTGGSYDRPSRAREFPVRPEPKRRWLRRLSQGKSENP
ncbi:MAG: MPMin1 gp31 [Gammaproteobacteria bacterium]|nr:MPMin1 gp31 [Gammaproteobacteria bacterium]